MKSIRVLVPILTGLFLAQSAQSKDLGPEVFGSCLRDSLKVCKMTTRSVDTSRLADYSKVMNCASRGSTSGDSFSLGVPLEGVPVSLGFGSTAEHSTQTCSTAANAIDKAKFAQAFVETFSSECGETAVALANQCFQATSKLMQPAGPQSLSCSAAQSSRTLTVVTRYQPAATEQPADREILEVAGLEGVSCAVPKYPGVSQEGSFVCQLPETHRGGSLTVRLNNSVSCAVAVTPSVQLEIAAARKTSCYSMPPVQAGRQPSAVDYLIAGACNACMKANLDTGESDQRSLEARFEGCAVWAATSAFSRSMAMCEVKARAPGGPVYAGMGVGLGLFGPAPIPLPGQPIQFTQPVVHTAPGTELGERVAMVPGDPDSERSADSLCNSRREGVIFEFKSGPWQTPPIDFLATEAGRSVAAQRYLTKLRAYIQPK